MKGLIRLAFALSLVAIVGCGQGYTPSPDSRVANPGDPGGVFGSNDDGTVYRTASYEVLRYTLTNTLALGTSIGDTALCGVLPVASQCPVANPVGYVDANKGALGAPIYTNEDPLGTQPPGTMTTGGMKVWVLAATSACGRMMTEQASPALFPNGISDYDYLYAVLLGRAPTQAEIDRLNLLQASYSSSADQGAAACGAVLGTLEFLTVN